MWLLGHGSSRMVEPTGYLRPHGTTTTTDGECKQAERVEPEQTSQAP